MSQSIDDLMKLNSDQFIANVEDHVPQTFASCFFICSEILEGWQINKDVDIDKLIKNINNKNQVTVHAINEIYQEYQKDSKPIIINIDNFIKLINTNISSGFMILVQYNNSKGIIIGHAMSLTPSKDKKNWTFIDPNISKPQLLNIKIKSSELNIVLANSGKIIGGLTINKIEYKQYDKK
jgi:hypothetical protein